MKIGPKYKIARRLGAPVFEKTQTAKYTLSLARKERSGMVRGRPKSEFGQALIEKQKTRFTYGLSEKQFRGYVDKVIRAKHPVQKLFVLLESRLDNVAFRGGLLRTRAQARQAAGHGHLAVNGKRITVPSLQLKVGDLVNLRPGSAESQLFAEASERMKASSVAWLELDPANKQAKVSGVPVYEPKEHLFDLGVVIEFYNR